MVLWCEWGRLKAYLEYPLGDDDGIGCVDEGELGDAVGGVAWLVRVVTG